MSITRDLGQADTSSTKGFAADTAATLDGQLTDRRDWQSNWQPRLYPLLPNMLVRSLVECTNRACLIRYRRFGWWLDGPLFSPYLYATGS